MLLYKRKPNDEEETIYIRQKEYKLHLYNYKTKKKNKR